jgi:hypothetical protein
MPSTLDPATVNAIVYERNQFIGSFQLSKSGNWWQRRADGTRITVHHKWGKWHWIINYADGSISYSPRPGWDSKDEAIIDCSEVLIGV